MEDHVFLRTSEGDGKGSKEKHSASIGDRIDQLKICSLTCQSTMHAINVVIIIRMCVYAESSVQTCNNSNEFNLALVDCLRQFAWTNHFSARRFDDNLIGLEFLILTGANLTVGCKYDDSRYYLVH